MKRTTILRALGATILLAGAAIAATPAAYVSGSVSSIPLNTQGTLELGETDGLHFHYGSDSFSVPYGEVTGFHSGRDDMGIATKLRRTMLPMVFGGNKYLTVEFQPEGAAAETLVFEMTGDELNAALPVLRAQTRSQRKEDTQAASAKKNTRDVHGTGDWYGNTLWRTERNQEYWPARAEEKTDDTVTVASTQDEE